MESTKRPLIERHAKLVILFFACLFPILFFGAAQAVRSKSNKVEDWLPESYRETKELTWFREHFTGDQFVVVSWKDCRLGDPPGQLDGTPDDPRIERLASLLLKSQPVQTDGAKTEEQYFASVTTARQVLDQMTKSPLSLRYNWAINRLKGSLIGEDGHQTCIVVMLSDDAVKDMRDVLGHGISGWFRFSREEGLLQKKMREYGIDPATAHFGGPPVDSVAIDEESEKSLYRLAMIAMLVGLTLAWWSLRSITLTLIVFACGIISALASLSVVWLSGETTDAFLLAMPPLVYVLAISGAVHLIKYYRDAAATTGLANAPTEAIFHGWKPTLLCSVTTAIGLLALFTSDLTPIRKFGVYSAVGVMLMLVMLFVFLPAALSLWPIRELDKNRAAKQRRRFFSSVDAFRWLDHFWQRFGSWITRHHIAVTLACFVVIIGFGVGVTRVRTNIDMMKLFNDQARIQQDYRWLESNVGKLVPIEIVLNFNQNALRQYNDSTGDRVRMSLLERMELVLNIKRSIYAKFGPMGEDSIGRPMSQLAFVPPLPNDRGNPRSLVRRSIYNSKLRQAYDKLQETGYLRIDAEGNELWRITLRVAAFKDVDYADFTGRLKELVDPIVDHYDQETTRRIRTVDSISPNAIKTSPSSEGTRSLSVVYTGVVPILYKAQRELLTSLVESTFWSFITITPLLIIVTRGIGSGLTAMLPNSLPVLVVFGGMGWFNMPVTIGAMMSASIALGVAVDDTIHFLTWYRAELKTSDRETASLLAYRRCATPTLQAALISGLGMAVFGFSNFTATKQFGLLMLVILIAGVVAELILLPALLAGPLGKTFANKNMNVNASHASESN